MACWVRQKHAVQQVKRENHQHSPNRPERKHGGASRHFHEDYRDHADENPESQVASTGGLIHRFLVLIHETDASLLHSFLWGKLERNAAASAALK